MLPKISIVTPSYNQGQFIEQTIDSILSQNYPNLEYIIIDGGSTDNTTDLIKKYTKHISYWISEPDKGQSHAINKGLRRSTGDVFNWLNSDDYYEPDTLKFVGEQFMLHNCNVLCGKSRIFNEEGTVNFSTGTDIYRNNLAKTIGWARIDQPETFIRKKLLDQIGCVNEDLHYIMDKELWMRILFQTNLNQIITSDKILANFRLHDQSKTISTGNKFEQEMDQLMYTTASNYSLTTIAHSLKTTFNLSDKNSTTLINTSDIELLSMSMNYYLFKRALELYTLNNFKKTKELLPYIQIDSLSIDEQKQLAQIKKRMNIPVFIKRFFNKFKSI